MANFDEDIRRISNEILNDGTVDKIIRENLTASIKKAIENAFSFGELSRAIDKKITSILVPFVEQADMNGYIVKLDSVLTEIINGTTLIDNKKLLENFKHLMKEPEEKTITVSRLFKEYKKFVAENMEIDGREIDTVNEEYVPMPVNVRIDYENTSFSSCFNYATLHFNVVDDDDEEQEEKLNRNIKLRKYMYDDEWHIDFDINPIDIKSLRYLPEFDILLTRLDRAFAKLVIDTTREFDDVYSVHKPEYECTLV
jgi:hypothetical protein